MPDGSYGKFRSDASDDVIRAQIAKDFPYAFKQPADTYVGPEYLRHAKPRGLSNPRFGQPMGEFQPAEDAARQAEEEHQRNLSSIAKTGKEILGSATKSSILRNISGVSGLGESIFSPQGVAVAAAQSNPFTAVPVDAALIGHGLYRFGANVGDALSGNPEAAESSLGGLAEATGGYAGYRGAPSLRSAVSRAAYTGSDLSPLAKSAFHPTQIPEQIFKSVFTPPEPLPTYPGASLPSADEFYAAKASDLTKRGVAQDMLDRRAASAARMAARSAPKPELGSPDNPAWFSKVPSRMPMATAAPKLSPFPAGAVSSNVPVGGEALPSIPPGSPTPFPQVEKPGAAALAPRIVAPSVREPRFTGSEGRAATWTNEDVLRLAQQGNREAIQQTVRRGLQLPTGARYVMGDPDFSRTVYNPRESTSFTPEGEPIRNVENPTVAAPRARIQVPQAGAIPRETINAATGEVFAPPTETAPESSVFSPPERRGSLRSITGPNPMRNALMDQLRARVATGDTLAQQQLDDMIAHPFEQHEGPDITGMKAQKTMSRAEAEANAKRRLEGRNKRFGREQ